MYLGWWRKPWKLLCVPCHALIARPSALEGNTCDNCGRVDPKGTCPAHLALGLVMVSLGRCDDCSPVATRPENR